MRYSNGGPDAHDMLLDRPEGLVRPPEPKITIEVPAHPGQDADLTRYGMQAPDAVRAHAAARDIEDDPAYLSAEQDADYQIAQLESAAWREEAFALLATTTNMIVAAHRKEPDLFSRLFGAEAGQMLQRAEGFHAAIGRSNQSIHRCLIDQHAARNPPWKHARDHYANWRERFFADHSAKTGRA